MLDEYDELDATAMADLVQSRRGASARARRGRDRARRGAQPVAERDHPPPVRARPRRRRARSTVERRSPACRSSSRTTRDARPASRTTPGCARSATSTTGRAPTAVGAPSPRRRADSDRPHEHARAGGDGNHRTAAYGPTHNPWDLGRSPGARRVDRRPRSRRASFRPPTPPTSPARSASRRRCAASWAQADPRAGDRQRRRSTGRHEHRGRGHALGARHGGARRPPQLALAVVAGAAVAPARSRTRSPPASARCGSGVDGRLQRRSGRRRLGGAPRPMPPTSSRTWVHHVDVSAPAVLSSDELWEAAKTAMAIAAASDAAGWKDRIGHALGEADLEPRHMGDGASRAGSQRPRSDGTDRADAAPARVPRSSGSRNTTCWSHRRRPAPRRCSASTSRTTCPASAVRSRARST